MNVTAKSKWKTVALDPQLRARGFAEGLLGIEELSDYQFAKVKKNAKVTNVESSKVLKAGKKRKKSLAQGKVVQANNEKDAITEDADDNSDEDNVVEDQPVIKKKKKTRQKRKPKEKKPKLQPKAEQLVTNKDSSDDDGVVDTDADNVATEEGGEDAQLEGWSSLPIPKLVLKALGDLKFSEPTPIQKETLPAAINGHADVVGAAETGSGKTLAFAIPMVHGILNDIEKESSEGEEIIQNDDGDEVPTEEENDGEAESSDSEKDEDDQDDGSSEEEEDMSDAEAETGCVKVVNDVEFDFDVDIEEIQAFTNPFELDRKQANSKNLGKLRGLVLTPTRELAIQVKDHIKAITKYTDIQVIAIVGGMASQKQIRLLNRAPEIVVATPGRLWDLVQEGHPHLAKMSTELRYLAIDETDRMVEKGHFEELTNLLEMLNTDEKSKKRRQTFVFSATLSLVHDLPKHLKSKKNKKQLTPEEKLKQVTEMIGVKPRPKIVDLTRKVGTAETLTESRIHCGSNTEKDLYLYYFLQQHPGRTIVFCNSIDCVRRLVNLFKLLWCEPLGLHAQMQQKQRLKNLDRFSSNPRGLLIATDVAARGLDIPNVEHVVHYQVPRTSESYIHRSGRTARANKEGLSVVLIDPSENQFYRRMCRTLNRDEDLPPFPVDEQILAAVKVRVNTARDLDKMLLASRKEEVSKSWLKKAAEEADLELSDSDKEDKFADIDPKSKRKSEQKNKIKAKEAELSRLLATPMHGQGFAGKFPTMTGKLRLPTDFRATADDSAKSALEAVSKSKAEMKALLKSSSKLATNPKKKQMVKNISKRQKKKWKKNNKP